MEHDQREYAYRNGDPRAQQPEEPVTKDELERGTNAQEDVWLTAAIPFINSVLRRDWIQKGSRVIINYEDFMRACGGYPSPRAVATLKERYVGWNIRDMHDQREGSWLEFS